MYRVRHIELQFLTLYKTKQPCSMPYLVVHLFWAVEDVDHDAQRSAQILGCLGLTSPGRASRSTAHCQVERLRQRDVAPTVHKICHIYIIYRYLQNLVEVIDWQANQQKQILIAEKSKCS